MARRLESSTANNNISKDKKEEELKWKEEREDLYERLAFVEEEAEDWKRELEVERERWREELEEVRGDLMVERSKTAVLNGGDGAADVNRGTSAADEVEDAIIAKGEETQQEEEHQGESSSKDQEYIKTLEDELELVTEQLIEAETKLSRAQAELEEAAAAVNVESADLNNSELVAELEKRVTELETESESLREELKKVKEELELALEGGIMRSHCLFITYANCSLTFIMLTWTNTGTHHIVPHNKIIRTSTLKRRTQSR